MHVFSFSVWSSAFFVIINFRQLHELCVAMVTTEKWSRKIRRFRSCQRLFRFESFQWYACNDQRSKGGMEQTIFESRIYLFTVIILPFLLKGLARYDSQTGLVKLPPLGKVPTSNQLEMSNFEGSFLHKHRRSQQVQEMIADVVWVGRTIEYDNYVYFKAYF